MTQFFERYQYSIVTFFSRISLALFILVKFGQPYFYSMTIYTDKNCHADKKLINP